MGDDPERRQCKVVGRGVQEGRWTIIFSNGSRHSKLYASVFREGIYTNIVSRNMTDENCISIKIGIIRYDIKARALIFIH